MLLLSDGSGLDQQPIVLCRQKDNKEQQIRKVQLFPDKGILVLWNKFTRCRMPSLSLPWMAQRLKWEAATVDDSNNLESKKDTVNDPKDDGNIGNVNFVCQAAAGNVSIQMLQEQWNLNSNVWVEKGDDIDDSDYQETFRINMAVVGKNNGKIQLVCREYSAVGELMSVLWSEGVWKS